MSGILAGQPLPPATVPICDPKTGLVAPAWSRFFRVSWLRAGDYSGILPQSVLPGGTVTEAYVNTQVSAAETAATAQVTSERTRAEAAEAVLAANQPTFGSVLIGTVAAGATGSGAVTFATAFTTAPTYVLVSSSSSGLSVGADPATLTATGFTYNYASRASVSGSYTLEWIVR